MSENKEIIDFSKLSPMMKSKVGKAIHKVLYTEAMYLFVDVQNYSEDSEAGKEMRGWLAAADAIIPVARELGKE